MDKIAKTVDDFIKGVEQAGKYVSEKAEEAFRMFQNPEQSKEPQVQPQEPNMTFVNADEAGTDTVDLLYDLIRDIRHCAAKIVSDASDSAEAIVHAFDCTYTIEKVAAQDNIEHAEVFVQVMYDTRAALATLAAGYSEKKRRNALNGLFDQMNCLEHMLYDMGRV